MTPTFVSTTRTYMAAPRNTDSAADNSSYIDESLGNRLRDRRILSGLSREQLAKRLRIGPGEIGAYESGAKRISADLLLRIARALGVRPDYFFRFSDQRVGGAAEDDQGRCGENLHYPTMLHEGLRLQRAFVSIRNATVRQSIVAFVVELARSQISN
jgi:transcriptional regulator with XRE-family HTH domain